MAPGATSPPLPSFSATDPITTLQAILVDESALLAQRFRALFALKHHGSQKAAAGGKTATIADAAVGAMAAALVSSPSALLKHEVAYCLGQTGRRAAVAPLRDLLLKGNEDPMCRHEAAEGLGALGFKESLDLLKRYRDDEAELSVVRETCEIAVERILWENGSTGAHGGVEKSRSRFASIDPAPSLDHHATISALKRNLHNTSLPLFTRYRAMFALRDAAAEQNAPSAIEAVEALALGFGDSSALFRHEIAFVFGQLSHPASIPSLVETLKNKDEQSMVRHEAAEALGSLGDQPGVEDILSAFADDPEPVVRESIAVALDMAMFERTGSFQYPLVFS